MSAGLSFRPLRVESVRYQAEDILSFELVDPDGKDLPPFTAGAHIDLHLGNGFVRSYSLSNNPAERHRYVVGVHRAPNSRGGSTWMHDQLRVGDLIDVSEPSNNFELDESADETILIAGGVGITPMLSMARRLEDEGMPWRIYYAAREHKLLAFHSELVELAGTDVDRLVIHLDAEQGKVLDLTSVVAAAGPGTHLYCCGPTGMLHAFEQATSELPSTRRHVEYFANDEAPATEGGFEIVLEQSGLTLTVPEGKTILDTMQEAGIDAPYSCGEGICGTCEIRVREGIPDHRDLVLTDTEKAANDVIMVCCSGSLTPRLVLDA